MEGTVKFFNQKKGYGFVSGDDGKDYFVHFSALTPGVFLRQDDRVSFDANDSDRGLKAEKVVLLQKGSEIKAANGGEKAPVEETSEEPEAEEETSEEPEAEEETSEEPEAEEETSEEPEAEEKKEE